MGNTILAEFVIFSSLRKVSNFRHAGEAARRTKAELILVGFGNLRRFYLI